VPIVLVREEDQGFLHHWKNKIIIC